MTQTSLNTQSNSIGNNYYATAGKSLGTKNLGSETSGSGATSTSNSSLAQWYEEANSYYSAVLNGTEHPDPSAWQSFLQELQWAADQLHTNQQFDTPQSQTASSATSQPDPFGGVPGTMNNTVYNNGDDIRVGFVGNGNYDVWTKNFTLDVAPRSAKIQVEDTTDSRTQPPEAVVKITVTDAATGTTATYIVHDAQDTHVTINAPGESSQVTNTSANPNITIGKFEKNGGAESESSIPGEPVSGESNAYSYEADTVDQTINFTPKAGDNETHYVVGNSNISVPISSKVQVGASDKPDYDYKVTVTHKDNSTDTYYVRKEFTTNINAVKDYVSFDGATQPGEVPADLKKIFSVNSGETTADSSDPNGEPSSVSADGKTATYENDADPSFTNYFDGDVQDYYITANGTFTLNPSPVNGQSNHYQISMEEKDGQLNYVIEVIGKDSTGNSKTITYHVKADQIQHININAAQSQIDNFLSPDSAAQINGLSATDKVKYNNKLQLNGQDLDGLVDSGTSDTVDSIMGNLTFMTGKSEDDILAKIQEIYPEFISYDADHDGALSKAELARAVQDGKFPPSQPDGKLFRLLTELDSNLSDALDAYSKVRAALASINVEPQDPNYQPVGLRLVDLLNAVYPGKASYDPANARSIQFNGQSFNFMNGDSLQLS